MSKIINSLQFYSRRWQREHKNAMIVGSPLFGGYLGNAQVKTPVIGTVPYQVTLEDRMRWAQIADVMAQANHYAVEPVSSPRLSSAAFPGHPNYTSINTLRAPSVDELMMKHSSGTLPPVPLPRFY